MVGDSDVNGAGGGGAGAQQPEAAPGASEGEHACVRVRVFVACAHMMSVCAVCASHGRKRHSCMNVFEVFVEEVQERKCKVHVAGALSRVGR